MATTYAVGRQNIFSGAGRRKGQNLFSKGLPGQLKKNALKNEQDRDALTALYTKIKERNAQIENPWAGQRLNVIVSEIKSWPEFADWKARVPALIGAAHRAATKDVAKAKQLYDKAKEAEKELNKAKGKNYGKKVVRDHRRKAIQGYTEALMNYPMDSEFFIKAMAGRARTLPLSDQLGAAYMMLAFNPRRATPAMEVAMALKRKADEFKRSSKAAEDAAKKRAQIATRGGSGGAVRATEAAGRAGTPGSKLKAAATQYYGKALVEISRALQRAHGDNALRPQAISDANNQPTNRFTPDRRAAFAIWAAKVYARILKSDPTALNIDWEDIAARPGQKKADVARQQKRSGNNINRGGNNFGSTDVYINIGVDFDAHLYAMRDFEGGEKKKKSNGTDGEGSATAKKRKQPAYLFYEYPVAFRYRGYLCPGCWRSVRSSLYPCSDCNEVYYCREICKTTDSHVRMCRLTRFIRSSMGPVAYLTCQLAVRATISEVIKLGQGFPLRNVLYSIYNNPANLHNTFNLYNVMLGTEMYHLDEHPVNPLMMSLAIELGLFIIQHLQTTTVPNANLAGGRTADVDHFNDAGESNYIVAVYKIFRCLFNSPMARSPMFNQDDTYVGTGLGTFGARLRRDCNGNVFRRFTGAGRIVYRACRDIKAGESLTIACGKKGGRPYGLAGACCATYATNRQATAAPAGGANPNQV